MSLIVPIAAAAINTGMGIYGQIRAAKEMKKQGQYLDNYERSMDSYYNGETSKNVLDTEYAQSALKKIRESLAERRKISNSTAAITGASDESQIAEKDNEAKAISGAVTSLAQYGSQRRDALKREQMGRKDGILQMRLGSSGQKAQSGMNLTNNAWNSIGSFIDAWGNEKKEQPTQ